MVGSPSSEAVGERCVSNAKGELRIIATTMLDPWGPAN